MRYSFAVALLIGALAMVDVVGFHGRYLDMIWFQAKQWGLKAQYDLDYRMQRRFQP